MSKHFRTTVLTAIALIIIPQITSAQGWIRTYGGPFGDYGTWVEATQDSGFVICGLTSLKRKSGTNKAGYDKAGYIAKVDHLGNVHWMRTYNFNISPELPYVGQLDCIKRTSDGGYVLTGWGMLEVLNLYDVWLLKIDSLGIVQWSRFYGGQAMDRGWSICQSPDGGYIVAGRTQSFGPGPQGLWLLRTDSLGDTLWTKTYGGEEMDWAYCVNLTSDGNYVVTGGNGAQNALWLLKIDDDGDIIWEKTYAHGGDTWGRYVEETPDGGFIVTGSSVDEAALYLVKTDEDGDSLWSHSYSGGNRESEGRCVHQTPDGGYVIGARKNYIANPGTCEAWLLKTDAWGDTVWTTSFGDLRWYNDFRSVQLAPDGGYVIIGSTGDENVDHTYEPMDIWLIKTDSLGFVSVAEDTPPVSVPEIQTATTVDTHITLYYTEHPNGFHANVYDATGRKVDEIHAPLPSVSISWGQGQQAGVYFIRVESGSSPSVQKVVLVK